MESKRHTVSFGANGFSSHSPKKQITENCTAQIFISINIERSRYRSVHEHERQELFQSYSLFLDKIKTFKTVLSWSGFL